MKSKLQNSDKRVFLKALLPMTLLGMLFSRQTGASSLQEINRPDVIPERKKASSRENPLIPPGSKNLALFSEQCTGCQLCVKVCPNGVLDTGRPGLGILQPGLSYEYGYCRPNCVKCGEVCPAGAISPVNSARKAKIKIGVANVNFENCVVHKDNVQCTACQRICPNEAISLVAITDSADSLKRPVVDTAKCTGCGACEYICAASPVAAIVVNGLKIHEIIKTA